MASIAAISHAKLVTGKAPNGEAKGNLERVGNFGRILAKNFEIPAINMNFEKEV